MFSTIGYYICIPFAWLVRFFYELTSSYGAAIILFTLVIKLIMLPFQMKSKKSMLRMNRMSGKIQEIQKKYANNQLKMQEEMQKFYQRMPVELSAPAHFDRALLHHPPAHHALHDAGGGCASQAH